MKPAAFILFFLMAISHAPCEGADENLHDLLSIRPGDYYAEDEDFLRSIYAAARHIRSIGVPNEGRFASMRVWRVRESNIDYIWCRIIAIDQAKAESVHTFRVAPDLTVSFE